jgi:thiamine-phosphate diphosphorylase
VEPVARRILGRCRAAGATFILNDHPGLAALVDADGVHIGQLDGSVADARGLIGPDRILGVSTHSADQLTEAARHADYVAFGPVFATDNISRPKQVWGLQALASLPPLDVPLVAIGGITRARLPDVVAAGVDAWAVIGAIANATDPVAATAELLAP